ncbi:MAG: dodecin [Rhodospirillaceae bacterium]|nr:dodecin [Rhodospirillaceae bacterium]
MSGHVYKLIELAGSSPKSYEDAIEGAIAKLGEEANELRWFEVREMRGHIDKGKVAHYQVVLRVGYEGYRP